MVIGFPQEPKGLGGPSSFQLRFENELKIRGYKIVYPNHKIVPDIIFVVGSTSKILWLRKMKSKGSKVIHRLDGMNWRMFVKYSGVKKTARGILSNILVNYVRSYLADYIVYQSSFVMNWWEREKGETKIPSKIIYNGTDQSVFYPSLTTIDKTFKILCAEGTLEPDSFIIDLFKKIASSTINGLKPQITILGKTDSHFNGHLANLDNIEIVGHVPKSEVPIYHRKNHVFLSIEINPACPNAIVEALASGLPVLGFASGAIPELVSEKEGVIMPYKNNPWKLQWPTLDHVIPGLEKIQSNYDYYRKNALAKAKIELNSKIMTSQYVDILNEISNSEK